MNTKDLMIGDWVCRNGKDEPVKVLTIGEHGCCLSFTGGYCGEAEDLIEPIPLTEEILEKNGFTSVEDPYNHRKYFLLGKNEYNCNVYWDGLDILLVEEDYEPHTYAYICHAEYVHELQHVLKLCKIEKEIVL